MWQLSRATPSLRLQNALTSSMSGFNGVLMYAIEYQGGQHYDEKTMEQIIMQSVRFETKVCFPLFQDLQLGTCDHKGLVINLMGLLIEFQVISSYQGTSLVISVKAFGHDSNATVALRRHPRGYHVTSVASNCTHSEFQIGSSILENRVPEHAL